LGGWFFVFGDYTDLKNDYTDFILGLHRFEDDYTDFILGLHRFEDDYTDLGKGSSTKSSFINQCHHSAVTVIIQY